MKKVRNQASQSNLHVEQAHNQKNNNLTYKCVKNACYISKDSIRITKIKDRTMYLVQTNNQVITIGMTYSNGQMKQIRKIPLELSIHSRNKFQLMNQSESFLHINPCQEIQIHTKDIHQNWSSEKSIYSNSREVSDIVINQNDDLIINGSNNGIIQFWNKESSWNLKQKLQFENEFHVGLCLNEEGNKLIVYGEKYQVYFLSLEQDGQWILRQSIKTPDYGHINFLTNNKFAYMSERSSTIQIYEYSDKNQEFINTENINLSLKKFYSYRLQVEYIEQMNALLAIKKNYFFLITNNEKGQQIIENLMQFQNDAVSFTTMQNGKYVVTLEQVKEMKENDYSFVRKLQIRSLRQCVDSQSQII